MAYSIYSKAGTDEAISSALADSLPTAPADIGAATAAQGALADATTVEQVTLTAPLAYTLPAGTPAGVVHRVVFTQNGTGGHTVTYDGQPVTVALTAGASTTVEFWPGGAVVYPGASAPSAGGSVDLVTLTTPAQAIVMPANPQAGDVATLIIAADGGTPSWDAAVTWEGGVGPTLSAVTGERDVLTFLYTGADWLGFVSGLFPALPDAEAPTTPTGLTATATSDTTVDLAWNASTDNIGVAGYEYRVDAGVAVDAFAGTTETVSGLTAATLYHFEVRAYDAAGNRSAWSTAATDTTQAAPIPQITDTFTRADSTTELGTTETGAKAWTATGGVFGVASGKAYLVSGLAADRPSATIDLGSLDQDIRVAFTGTYVDPLSFYQMIVGRWADKANCYQMMANWSSTSPGVITLTRRVGGTNESIYTSPRDTYPPTGGVMRLYIKEEVGGTRLRAYLGETRLTDFLDTNASRPAVSTRAGIAIVPNASLAGTPRFDDFEALIP